MRDFGSRDSWQRRLYFDPAGIPSNQGRLTMIMLTAQKFVQTFPAERHPRIEDEHTTCDMGLQTSEHGPQEFLVTASCHMQLSCDYAARHCECQFSIRWDSRFSRS
jgi:hypothetical protein